MRLIARYAKDLGEGVEVVTVYDKDTERVKIDRNEPRIKTITAKHPAAIWFERKMFDDFGIKSEGAFDNRPLLHHERFPRNIHPMKKDFNASVIEFRNFRPYRYETIEGEGIFEVSVGPIHAGIIEPGHFHFSQAGEAILHQEVRHFYKYRAIEKMLEGMELDKAKSVIGRISGNESIAFQIAWRNITAEACGIELPLQLKKYHALLLELERIIHHLTDLGFIANDAGFAAALAFASTLAEQARRIMYEMTGHRFGFDAVNFSGVTAEKNRLIEWINHLEKEMVWFREWIFDIPSLWERFDRTGHLSDKKAKKYDCVGIIARASGIAIDRRLDSFYLDHGFSMVTESGGDVAARYSIRIKEVFNSIEMIRNFAGGEKFDVKLSKPSDGSYTTFVESSIGELFMAIDIQEQRINRFYARDPSFINWQVLHLMMPGNIIADFPLINKSCDLSYAGNDL